MMNILVLGGTMNHEVATLAGGCFWCLEAVYDQLKGVQSVESGYMGGKTPNPTYDEVCGGNSGHAEVVRITFDPAQASYEDLFTFFTIHDPTTLNAGNDVGTQYRSAIFSTRRNRSAPQGMWWRSSRRSGSSATPSTEIVPASQFHGRELPPGIFPAGRAAIPTAAS
jgi:peptide-methionine (S)-S-oxide reductase